MAAFIDAGLVEGQYKGGRANGSGASVITTGIHTPTSKIPYGSHAFDGGVSRDLPGIFIAPQMINTSSIFLPLTASDLSCSGGTYTCDKMLVIGRMDNIWVKGGIYPADAQHVDAKMDDGLPSSGKIVSTTVGGNGFAANWADSCANTTVTPPVYKVSVTSAANCTLIMRNAF